MTLSVTIAIYLRDGCSPVTREYLVSPTVFLYAFITNHPSDCDAFFTSGMFGHFCAKQNDQTKSLASGSDCFKVST
jgi:hypothetical protein